MLALHLVTAIVALALGPFILLRPKGVRAQSSFWLRGMSEGFSPIHLLSAWTLVAMALAVYFIRKGDVTRHRRFMVGTYLGLAGAAVGAVMPGRMIYLFLAG